MLINLSRFFLRLLVLLLVVFSIFYFYIFGYRFDSKLGFIESAGVYSLEKIDLGTNEKVIINGEKYNLVDNKIILHNMFIPKSCGKIKIGKFQDYICYNTKKTKHIVYISKKIISLKPVKNTIYLKKLSVNLENNPNIKYSFSWHNIKFFYYENGDIVYKDDISYKKLINLKDLEFVGYDNKGLYVVKNNSLYFMKLSN